MSDTTSSVAAAATSHSSRPSEVNNPTKDHARGLPLYDWIVPFAIALILLLFVIWYIYTRLRARRLGIPPPSLNPFAGNKRTRVGSSASRSSDGGIVGWFKDKFGGNGGGGGYTGTGVRRGRTFGAMDPDEAWDTRVGAEADYTTYGEEQELGVQAPFNSTARGYGPVGGLEEVESATDGRGRARAGREDLEERYQEEMHGGGGGTRGVVGNPYDEGLRGISPRPHVEAESPTERKSMFREEV